MQQTQVSKWESAQLNFEPLSELNPPLKVVLTALQVAEAVLEAVLDVLKTLMLAFDNPISAVVSLLLAAIRLIINQIRATGFSVLFVLPDFSRADAASVFASVSGAYPEFERKVLFKLSDQTDLFRPDYPNGSSVVMGILYFGADTPGDLLSNIYSIVSFFSAKSLNIRNFIQAPTNVKVMPVAESTDPFATVIDVKRVAVRTFAQASSANYVQSLLVEWSMPTTIGGSAAPGFLNPFISLYNTFSFPKFLIERTTVPNGKTIDIDVDTPTSGQNIETVQLRFGNTANKKTRVLRDTDGVTPFRFFEKKFVISDARLVQAAFNFNSKYRYLDDTVEPGVTYYYRVRAFFGDPTYYVNAAIGEYNAANTKLIKISGNTPIMKYGDPAGITMGKSSAVASGISPGSVVGILGNPTYNPYVDFFNIALVGFLLNMELPAAFPEDNNFTRSQKTGWGTLGNLGSVIVSYKAALKNSKDFKNNALVKSAIRRMVNNVLNSFIGNPQAATSIYELYEPLRIKVQNTISNEIVTWKWPQYNFGDITGGIPDSVKLKINTYLALEREYRTGEKELPGPYPTYSWASEGLTEWSVDDRKDLASLLSAIFSAFSANSGYLRWYSLTLGDLFPSFIPFIFNLEEFVGSILKSLKNVLQEITNIIDSALAFIKQLEEIINTISQIINLLSVRLTVSVFGYASYDGNTASLASGLLSSENKPVSSPYGLHSGIVVTAGGPGIGPVKIFEALGFILGIKF